MVLLLLSYSWPNNLVLKREHTDPVQEKESLWKLPAIYRGVRDGNVSCTKYSNSAVIAMSINYVCSNSAVSYYSYEHQWIAIVQEKVLRQQYSSRCCVYHGYQIQPYTVQLGMLLHGFFFVYTYPRYRYNWHLYIWCSARYMRSDEAQKQAQWLP